MSISPAVKRQRGTQKASLSNLDAAYHLLHQTVTTQFVDSFAVERHRRFDLRQQAQHQIFWMSEFDS